MTVALFPRLVWPAGHVAVLALGLAAALSPLAAAQVARQNDDMRRNYVFVGAFAVENTEAWYCNDTGGRAYYNSSCSAGEAVVVGYGRRLTDRWGYEIGYIGGPELVGADRSVSYRGRDVGTFEAPYVAGTSHLGGKGRFQGYVLAGSADNVVQVRFVRNVIDTFIGMFTAGLYTPATYYVYCKSDQ